MAGEARASGDGGGGLRLAREPQARHTLGHAMSMFSRPCACVVSLSTAITCLARSFAMFAAATSLFARSALNANYHIQGQPGFPSIASPSFGSSAAARPTAPAAIEVPPFSVGLWRILKATNKTTQKVRISIASEWRWRRQLTRALLRTDCLDLSRA